MLEDGTLLRNAIFGALCHLRRRRAIFGRGPLSSSAACHLCSACDRRGGLGFMKSLGPAWWFEPVPGFSRGVFLTGLLVDSRPGSSAGGRWCARGPRWSPLCPSCMRKRSCGSAHRGRHGRSFTRAPRVVDVSRRPIVTIEPDRPVCAIAAIDRNKRRASAQRLQKPQRLQVFCACNLWILYAIFENPRLTRRFHVAPLKRFVRAGRGTRAQEGALAETHC